MVSARCSGSWPAAVVCGVLQHAGHPHSWQQNMPRPQLCESTTSPPTFIHTCTHTEDDYQCVKPQLGSRPRQVPSNSRTHFKRHWATRQKPPRKHKHLDCFESLHLTLKDNYTDNEAQSVQYFDSLWRSYHDNKDWLTKRRPGSKSRPIYFLLPLLSPSHFDIFSF